MPHLYSFRKGWESENIARYLLSRFCFIAHPSTVSDDIGSDFYCTLFQTQIKEGNKFLLPRNSFAIQIKSNKKTIDVSDKIRYLIDLELPFFVGVIDRNNLSLDIYSGEYLPMFFSLKGDENTISNLCIELGEGEITGLDNSFYEGGERSYVLKFPRIAEVKAEFEDEELRLVVDNLCEICSFIHRNIASKKNREYIFELQGSLPPRVYILAGKGSVQIFRDNFLKRLAEVFYNLEWLKNNFPVGFSQDEFRVYSDLFYKLENLYGELPPYLIGPYYSLKKCLEDASNS